LFDTRGYARPPISRPVTRRTFVAAAGAAASILLGVAPPSTPSAVGNGRRGLALAGGSRYPPRMGALLYPRRAPGLRFQHGDCRWTASAPPQKSRRSVDHRPRRTRRPLADPVLEWSWKTIGLPAGADVRRAATSDLSAHLLVVWPRAPRLVRSRILAYAWDTTAPANTIERSHKTPTVTFVIVRSGNGNLARWLTERRDVRADYRSVYGEEPEPVQAVALWIDTNDTGAPAEAFIGEISFQPR
jgi:Protein of unknown function (DUF3047)